MCHARLLEITDRAFVNGVPTGDQGPLQYFVADQGRSTILAVGGLYPPMI